MAEPPLTRRQRDAAKQFMAEVSEPSFEMSVIDCGRLEGMRAGTARDTFHRSLPAVVELQACGENPTNKALAQAGAPIDSLARLLTSDLSSLPSVQLRSAVDDHIVDAPGRILVESRTERATGPDKFGVIHPHKPPGVGGGEPRGAANTTGGVASAIAVADCGDTFMPCGQVQIPQGWWHPHAWIGVDRKEIELALRERANFFDQPFLQTPHEIASALLANLSCADNIRDWDIRLDGTIVVGGRLSLGYPVRSDERYGHGGVERYLGADLSAVALFRPAGLEAFFEMPHRTGALDKSAASPCSWTFLVDGSTMTLAELVEAARQPGGPWIDVPSELVRAALDVRVKIRRLAVEASDSDTGPLPLQLVFMVGPMATTELFVTTIDADEDEESVTRLIRLADREAARRRPGSPMERSVQTLLRDGHLQTTPRRRYPERRGYGAVAATAFGVLQVARRTG